MYQYNADGTGGRLFARGLRNAEGLDTQPGTKTVWVAVNNRDNIAYPLESQRVPINWDRVQPDQYLGIPFLRDLRARLAR